MHQRRSTPRLSADAAWSPAHWSVRTKISVVLLLPVLVAVALAVLRVQGELDRATTLSAARDRLPVLHDTVELTAALGQEMVAAVAVPGGAPATLTASVDAKVAAIQRDTGFAPLAADTGRTLNTALGKLAGIRAAGAGGGDVRTKAAGYNGVIASLGDLVPALVPADVGSETAVTAESTRLLLHLRGELSTEETYVRAAQTSPDDASLRPAVVLTSAEQEVLAEQAEHQLPPALAPRFAVATQGAEGRLTALQDSGADGDAALAGFLPSITGEVTGVTSVLNDVAADLTGQVSAAADRARADSLRDTALVLGALLGALAIALLVVRSLVTPVRRLRAAALLAANEQLPETVRQVREGVDVDWRAVPAVGVKTEEEIGQLARAFDDMHRQAVRLAVEQAELRKQVSEMFMTLSRRSQSLVEQQLSIIEDLESGEQNPRRLDELFRIDHIATRLRRNGENLHVLAGGRPVRHGREPVPTRDLLRAATSEVKDYRRVSLGNAPRSSVQPEAAADVVHILAELLENATRFSPPEHKVALTADRGADGGLLIEVVDQGLGMTPAELTAINDRLAAAGTVGPETTRRMGLFVVGRLAALHGVTVRLRATAPGVRHAGVTASVHVPGALVIADLARPIGAGRLSAEPAPAGGSRRNGHSRSVPVVPAQASTPIFEQVVTSWFTEPSAKPAVRRPAADPVSKVDWPTADATESGASGELADRPELSGGAGDLAGRAGLSGGLGGLVGRSGLSGGPGDLAGRTGVAGEVGDQAGRSGLSGGAGESAGRAGASNGAGDLAGRAGLSGGAGDLAGRTGLSGGAGDPAGRSGLSGGAGDPAGRAGLSNGAGDLAGRAGLSGGAGDLAGLAGLSGGAGDQAGRPELSGRAGRGESSASPEERGKWAESSADRPARTDLNGTAQPPISTLLDGTDSSGPADAEPSRASAGNGAAAPPSWDTPADRTRQAAESALKPAAVQQLTDAGLPTRRPGAQLAPGAALPRVREQDNGAFRDPSAVRNSLSRHYQGMRAARQQTAARTEEPGKDGVDPR